MNVIELGPLAVAYVAKYAKIRDMITDYGFERIMGSEEIDKDLLDRAKSYLIVLEEKPLESLTDSDMWELNEAIDIMQAAANQIAAAKKKREV